MKWVEKNQLMTTLIADPGFLASVLERRCKGDDGGVGTCPD